MPKPVLGIAKEGCPNLKRRIKLFNIQKPTNKTWLGHVPGGATYGDGPAPKQ
jgi:hypothetical protein